MGIKPIKIKELIEENLYFLRYELSGDNLWTFGNPKGGVVRFIETRNHLIKFRVYSGYKINSLFDKGDIFWEEISNVMFYPMDKEDIKEWVVDLL